MFFNSHVLEMSSACGSQKGKSDFVYLPMSPGPLSGKDLQESRCKKDSRSSLEGSALRF